MRFDFRSFVYPIGLAAVLVWAMTSAHAQTSLPEQTTPLQTAPLLQTAAVAEQPAEPPIGVRIAARAEALGLRFIDPADMAALKAYYTDTAGKALWIEDGAFTARARAVVAEIGRADAWGLSAIEFPLPDVSTSTLAPEQALDEDARLTLSVLKYARHARGGRVDPARLADNFDRSPTLMDPAQVLAGIAAATEPDAYLRALHPQHPQFERLRQLLLAVRAGRVEQSAPVAAATPEPEAGRRGKRGRKSTAAKTPVPPPPVSTVRVLANMEQWRWMPTELGRLHAIVNIPEFALRVVRDGREIYKERVVVGTRVNQTPIFSKDMQTVVFQPGWGVPPGIKVKELLPRLLAGGDPITARGLVVRHRGREADPLSIDWRSVDIRKISIVQPPGPGNALGMVKFLFPNKHDVYMHDTPSKSLFNADMRAFSHGCVRVRNPMRFAELVFAETGGWSPSRVASLARGKPENEVQVPAQLSVHMVYFTVTVDDDGKVHTFRDIYGHEPVISHGLEGRYDKVARKSEDLGQLRNQLIGSVRGSRGNRSDMDVRERPSRSRATSPRQRQGSNRSATVVRSGGGNVNIFTGF